MALKEDSPEGLVLGSPASVGLRTGLALTLPEPMVESFMEAKPLPWLPPESAPGKHEVMLVEFTVM